MVNGVYDGDVIDDVTDDGVEGSVEDGAGPVVPEFSHPVGALGLVGVHLTHPPVKGRSTQIG